VFARITWSKLPPGSSLEQAVSNVRDRILPSVKTQDGFLGVAMLANSETGEGVMASYWQTAEAMAASEAMGSAARAQAAQATGAIVGEVDRFELLLNDRAAPAKVGSAVRANDATIPLARVDAMLAFMRDTSIPASRQLSGYQSTRLWLNRDTGRMVLSTGWDTAAERQSSEAVLDGGMRRQAAEIAQLQGPVRINLYEVVLLDLTPAMQQAATTTASTT
jgi:heme-degrading monooxygenase HmoA